MNENFSSWCEVNGQLSEARDHAEKVIEKYAHDEIEETLRTGFDDLTRNLPALTDTQVHDVRLALGRVVTSVAGNIFSLTELLESHGGNVSQDASFRYVKKGVDLALDEEFGRIHELWKKVNT